MDRYGDLQVLPVTRAPQFLEAQSLLTNLSGDLDGDKNLITSSFSPCSSIR